MSDALHGRLSDHHRLMLELYPGQHEALGKAIARIDQALEALTARIDAEVAAGQATVPSLIILVCSIPGIRTLAATVILAEIGRDPGLRRGRR